MRVIIRRAIVPGVLLTSGIALVAYGAIWHAVAVVAEQEEQKTISVPQPFAPPAFGGMPGMPGSPGASGPPAPPPIRKTVNVLVRKVIDTDEPKLVREITFGGVIRLANGELKRTYTGHAPSLCPS